MNNNRYGRNGLGSNAQRTADGAVLDAMNVVGAVRNLDPDDVWQELRVWALNDRHRLFAAVIALAAMVPQDKTPSQLLAWTEPLAPYAANHEGRAAAA